MVIGKYEDHHVFQLFRTNQKYSDFWMTIFGKDFDSDKYCAPVEPHGHRVNSNAITQEWKDFIDEWDAKLTSGEVTRLQAGDAAIEKVFDQGKRYNFDVSKLKTYGEKEQAGKTVDLLMKLHQKVHPNLNINAHPVWNTIIKKVGSRLGRKIWKVAPVVGYVLTAASVAQAANDPTGALSDFLDVSRPEAAALLNGSSYITIVLWSAGKSVAGRVCRDLPGHWPGDLQGDRQRPALERHSSAVGVDQG